MPLCKSVLSFSYESIDEMSSKMRAADSPDGVTRKPPISKDFHISDDQLFTALAPIAILKDIQICIASGDYSAASVCWAEYMDSRKDAPLPAHHLASELRNNALIEDADYIAEHRIRISGSRRTDFGKEINFISLVKEHRLEELHSLSFLANLTTAYRLTKAAKYVAAFQDILSQWFAQYLKVQPASESHPVWNDSSCGIRIIAVLDAYNEMKSEKIFSPAFHKMMLSIVLSSARWLYCSQEEYRSGSPALDACAALILAGVYLPELREASEWLDHGIKCIIEKTSKEFNKEGAFCEMSDAYAVKSLTASFLSINC